MDELCLRRNRDFGRKLSIRRVIHLEAQAEDLGGINE
jgi:hypothetical protein